MAGSGMTSWRKGWKVAMASGGGTSTEWIELEKGYGTPTHAAPVGTVYAKLDATVGTSSLFRRTDGAAWTAMSDG